MARDREKFHAEFHLYELVEHPNPFGACDQCCFSSPEIRGAVKICNVNSMSTWRQQKFECMPEGKDGKPIMNLYWAKKDSEND